VSTRKAALVRRLTAVTAATGLVGLLAAAPVFADGSGSGSGVHVVNTETVQVYLNSKGDVQSKRVYEQIALTGHGDVDFANPVSTDSLRNLDGFGGFEVRGGDQIVKTSVDGTKHYRSVSNYDQDLPVSITPEYYLDGERVNPGDIVGESGSLRVQFTVKNLTTHKQQVSYPDGHGGTTTSAVDVPVPMVGSLTTDLPSTFTHVQPGGANTAGDGTGGTTMSYTMTLFPPIGSTTARFGYTADITDGVVPDVNVSMLPVDPMASPTFKSAADSYKGGADTGAQLVDGAGQIDTNLLKLRDGAATLLAGLIKLRNGADQLHTGLADTAAPGAKKLADGAGQLDDGLGQINDGAEQLAGGSGQLADGARRLSAGAGEAYAGGKKLRNGAIRLRNGLGDANDGGQKLKDGAERLSAGLLDAHAKAPQLVDGLTQLKGGLQLVHSGLTQMYDQVGGIPTQAQPLFDGIDQLIAGIGSSSQPGTIIYGIDAVRAGLSEALPKIETMADGVYNTDAANPGAYQKLTCAGAVLEAVKDGTLGGGDLTAGSENPCFMSTANPRGLVPPMPALDPTQTGTQVLGSVISQLGSGRDDLATPGNLVNQSTLYGGLMTLKAQLSHIPSSAVDQPGAIAALAAVECGLDSTSVDSVTLPGGVPASVLCRTDADGKKLDGVTQGLDKLSAGVDQLVNGIVQRIQAGIGDLTDTPVDMTLRGGLNGLTAGVDQLSTGGDLLLAGLNQLATGSVDLANGTADLSTGLVKLNDGGLQLAAGAGTLTSGLGQISSGAGDLSAGADKLHAGAGDLADGTARSKDGSSQVADGASQLSDGLGDAADGSGRIADGLQQAANGAPQLVDGAQRLSTEGMGQLVKAGESTAQNYGEMYAVMQAGAERAHTHSMAFGAPKGADGLTAYSFIMKGDDGESGRNWTRGIAALAVLGLGAGAFALRRRLA
jgi:putative membrane protein